MITKEDYKNLLEYFTYSAVPENLKNFVAKLEVIYEELNYREEVGNKIQELHKKLEELSKNDEKEAK